MGLAKIQKRTWARPRRGRQDPSRRRVYYSTSRTRTKHDNFGTESPFEANKLNGSRNVLEFQRAAGSCCSRRPSLSSVSTSSRSHFPSANISTTRAFAQLPLFTQRHASRGSTNSNTSFRPWDVSRASCAVCFRRKSSTKRNTNLFL